MKKSILVVLTFFAITVSLCCSASAASVSSGTIPSAALDYFEGLIDKLEPGEDYFVYKSGDYTSVMIYGYGLKLDGSVLSATDVTQLTYNTRGVSAGSGYNYNPTFTSVVVSSVQINTDQTSIVYSSLGDWSTLGSQKSNDILTYILWTVLLIFFIVIIFKFFRNRRSYISL